MLEKIEERKRYIGDEEWILKTIALYENFQKQISLPIFLFITVWWVWLCYYSFCLRIAGFSSSLVCLSSPSSPSSIDKTVLYITQTDPEVIHDDSELIHDDPEVIHDDQEVIHDDQEVIHDDQEVIHDDQEVIIKTAQNHDDDDDDDYDHDDND